MSTTQDFTDPDQRQPKIRSDHWRDVQDREFQNAALNTSRTEQLLEQAVERVGERALRCRGVDVRTKDPELGKSGRVALWLDVGGYNDCPGDVADAIHRIACEMLALCGIKHERNSNGR